MRSIKLSAAFLLAALFITSCNSDQPNQTAIPDSYSSDGANPAETEGEEYWAKDNFDLQRVGDLLEKSDSPEQFERYLNEPDGINNLDLNGDGYADYISVEEYEDRDTNSRGLSLFSRFGPDLIQEIATILLYRDEPNHPGARFLIDGNDQLYGDNYYYESNWLDRTIPIVSSLFGNHDQYYNSPYYYDNYPSWYQPYDIVETTVYRTRVERLYPQPAFVYTTSEPVYFTKVKIKSPNHGRHFDKIHARLVKPNQDQEAFIKSNPAHAKFKRGRDDVGQRNDDLRSDKHGRDNPPRSDRGDDRGNPGRDDRGAERGNPEHRGGGNPNKGGDNPNKGAGNPKQGGGNPNKGGGKPNKGGGGNPNKGGGKGGGKKG